MAKNSVNDWDVVANNNTDIAGISIAEGATPPQNVNNGMRAIMGQVKAFFKTSLFRLRDGTDQTKLLTVDISAFPTATTRTLSFDALGRPDVNGGSASQDNYIPRFDGTTGQLQNSAVVINDSGSMGLPITPAGLLAAGYSIALFDDDSGFRGVSNGLIQLVLNNTIMQTFTPTARSIGATGYTRLFGDVILQWGFAGAGSGSGTVTLPVAYPANNAIVVGNIQTNSTTQSYSVTFFNRTSTQFSYSKTYVAGGTVAQSVAENFLWVSIGY